MEKTPAYARLKEWIQQKIETGALVPGDALPSERALAAQHSLSRMTVRQAISELVSAGALYREQGRGTFVTARKMKQRNIASFSDTVRQMGFTPSTQVVSFSSAPPPPDIAAALMTGGAKVYRALRLRLADDNPVALEEVFIPKHICPALKTADLKSSLYVLIEKKYGKKIGSADSSVSALHLGAQQQQYLLIGRNTPVLNVNSLYYSVSGEALYFERAVYRSDMYEYNIRISTPPK